MAPVVDHHHQPGIEQVDPQQNRGGDEDQAPVLTGEQPVDESPKASGKPSSSMPVSTAQGKSRAKSFAMGLVVGEETA